MGTKTKAIAMDETMLYVGDKGLLKETTPDGVLRRQALERFVINPAATIIAFPEQTADLIHFFAHSTNPYVNIVAGTITVGFEDVFEQWEIARQWAMNYAVANGLVNRDKKP